MSDERTNVIISPLPGLIVRILVKKGDIIKSGQVVALINVMKTEIEVRAENDGVVEDILVREGDEVDVAAPLVKLITAVMGL